LIRQAFTAGARSFILKTEPLSSLVEAIRSLAQHKPFFTNKVSEVLFSRIVDVAERDENSKSAHPLSAREREIVQLLAEGKSNKDVAAALASACAPRKHIEQAFCGSSASTLSPSLFVTPSATILSKPSRARARAVRSFVRTIRIEESIV